MRPRSRIPKCVLDVSWGCPLGTDGDTKCEQGLGFSVMQERRAQTDSQPLFTESAACLSATAAHLHTHVKTKPSCRRRNLIIPPVHALQ